MERMDGIEPGAITATPDVELNVGVVNPFALVEARLGRRVGWSKVDARKVLEEELGVSYDRLFDPTKGSPLYPGLRVENGRTVVDRAAAKRKGEEAIRPREQSGAGDGPSVGGTAWVDVGDFFEETTELLDPVQGAVADCYLIAALSSVAWARPYVVAQRTRAVDAARFVDLVEFFDAGKSVTVEVSESLPVYTPGNYLVYARSSDAGEVWPGVYEKAFAKWRNGHAGDTPDIPAIAYGDPVGAAAQLTNLTPTYYWTSGMTPEAIWQTVRGNSLSYKTFNPMVAWTYGSSDPAAGRDYSTSNLVANHAYSLLGWSYVNNQMYVILRNPWGGTEATVGTVGGNWVAWDAPYGLSVTSPAAGGRGFWRAIDLAASDGIFALRADTFRTYFSGFGVVK